MATSMSSNVDRRELDVDRPATSRPIGAPLATLKGSRYIPFPPFPPFPPFLPFLPFSISRLFIDDVQEMLAALETTQVLGEERDERRPVVCHGARRVRRHDHV